jgi:2-polyprenyl-6-methoxyphenol hydroxylase-like FAD-dependent oxidoreductase
MPGMRIWHNCWLEDFAQRETGVVATVRDLATGNNFSIASDYLVGCDGGRSLVRKKIGARLDGTPVIQRVQSTYIRAPDLLRLVPGEPATTHSIPGAVARSSPSMAARLGSCTTSLRRTKPIPSIATGRSA